MTKRYGQDTYQCGRYEAIGWEKRCTKGEIWTSEDETLVIERYYYDASISGPDDDDVIWGFDDDGFDGSENTFAFTATPATDYNDQTDNRLKAVGLNYPETALELKIVGLKFRFRGSAYGSGGSAQTVAGLYFLTKGTEIGSVAIVDQEDVWSAWSSELVNPGVAWDVELLQNLEIRFFGFMTGGSPIIFKVHKAEVEVTYHRGPLDRDWTPEVKNVESWDTTAPIR